MWFIPVHARTHTHTHSHIHTAYTHTLPISLATTTYHRVWMTLIILAVGLLADNPLFEGIKPYREVIRFKWRRWCREKYAIVSWIEVKVFMLELCRAFQVQMDWYRIMIDQTRILLLATAPMEFGPSNVPSKSTGPSFYIYIWVI
jgi:hypothetical protein